MVSRHLAGEGDYLLKVRCAGTRELEHVIIDEIKVIPGVVQTRTTVVLSTLKETPVVPLPSEPEPELFVGPALPRWQTNSGEA